MSLSPISICSIIFCAISLMGGRNSVFGSDKGDCASIAANLEGEEDEEEEESLSDDYRGFLSSSSRNGGKKRHEGGATRTGAKIWDHWGKWSGCSVSCGIGKLTRWRHCVSGGCAPGEKEAQIKTCTLPSC